MKLKRVSYKQLNSKQKETWNFQKVSAVLADFGYTTIRLSSDWCGADFIAQHINGRYVAVQLKTRLTFNKKYMGVAGLHVCFPHDGEWFIYPRDVVLKRVLDVTGVRGTESWTKGGGYSFPGLSKQLRSLLEPYRLS